MSRSNAECIDSFVLRGANSVIKSSDSESLTGLYQSHRMRLMQISGLGGAEIVGRENAKKPRIDLIAMNAAEICLGRTSANHLTQHR
jgi:hypothetical protein